MKEEKDKRIILDMNYAEDDLSVFSTIESAQKNAAIKLEQYDETIETLQAIVPECDKIDYVLAACSGVLCGITDVFLVGKPGESPVCNFTDKIVAKCVMDFAKRCNWKPRKEPNLYRAIEFLERHFKVCYDQNSISELSGKEVFGLDPQNHHFKALGHNPTLLGLFFSILDQFKNNADFVSDGELIQSQDPRGSFELKGSTVPEKIFFGFINWFGHIMSDISGSHDSKGRGMGIPSPFWAWVNDIVVIRRKIGIPSKEWERNLCNFASKIFEQGFDVRFQAAQAIPVAVNELVVRFFYAIRRLIQFYAQSKKEVCTFENAWNKCEPFSNPTVKRMLITAHGVFCLVDLGDATIRGFLTGGGSFNVTEFFLRMNLVGVGRVIISLYGETKRSYNLFKTFKRKPDLAYIHRERILTEEYIEGLKTLSDLYDDRKLFTFIEKFQTSGLYMQAFQKSVQFAEKRCVPEQNILKDKTDIDRYFSGEGDLKCNEEKKKRRQGWNWFRKKQKK